MYTLNHSPKYEVVRGTPAMKVTPRRRPAGGAGGMAVSVLVIALAQSAGAIASHAPLI